MMLNEIIKQPISKRTDNSLIIIRAELLGYNIKPKPQSSDNFTLITFNEQLFINCSLFFVCFFGLIVHW